MNHYNIGNKRITAAVSTLGAELQSVKNHDGTEYIWQGDSRFWSGKSPLLFPYVGRLTGGKYVYHDMTYFLPIHGFASSTEFRVVHVQDDSITMLLTDSEETLKIYPFHFELRVTYLIIEDTLHIQYDVCNTSQSVMYFGLGGHPGFNVPLEPHLSFEDYYIQFEKHSIPQQIGMSPDKFVTHQVLPYPLNQLHRLPLSHGLFDHDAIVLQNTGGRVNLQSLRGTHGVEVIFPQINYLGIWHKQNTSAPYVCIEPWISLPAFQNETVMLEKQANLITLDAADSYHNQWSIRFY